MIVPLRSPNGDITNDWIIIELQGKITPLVPGDSFDGIRMGEVTLLPGNKTASLLVGNHKVSGTVEKLSKPMVIVAKVSSPSSSSPSSSSSASLANDDHDENTVMEYSSPSTISSPSSIEYQVQAIVRYRLLFTERPKPVLGTSIGLVHSNSSNR